MLDGSPGSGSSSCPEYRYDIYIPWQIQGLIWGGHGGQKYKKLQN